MDYNEWTQGLVLANQYCMSGKRCFGKTQIGQNSENYALEFSSYHLDINDISESDKLFNIMMGLQT